MTHTWRIEEGDAGKRLDVFLASQLPELTRSALAKRLKQGKGQVNGKTATVHRFLKIGDEVVLDETERAQKGKKEPAPPKKREKLAPLKIIAETPEWIVINKPTGLLVHPDHEHPTGTLVDLLVAHAPQIAKIGEDPSRPGIMHRLDKDVSGLMVIAKTQHAFDHLKKQFAEHHVDKRYLALVHGELRKDEGDIKFRIARSKSKARMAARPEHEDEGQAAWTHYNVLKRFHGATLCQLAILSGRTHQIRAHMHGLGHPVMGDALYILRQPDRNVHAPRLMLQSVHLGFKDPQTNDQVTFDITPDPAFDDLTKTFKELSNSSTPPPQDS